jgi:hypothetical protein
MEFVYHIVTIRVNETSWAHVWRLRSHYLGTGYDIKTLILLFVSLFLTLCVKHDLGTYKRMHSVLALKLDVTRSPLFN